MEEGSTAASPARKKSALYTRTGDKGALPGGSDLNEFVKIWQDLEFLIFENLSNDSHGGDQVSRVCTRESDEPRTTPSSKHSAPSTSSTRTSGRWLPPALMARASHRCQ